LLSSVSTAFAGLEESLLVRLGGIDRFVLE
jgi:hypothetical protein